MSTHLNSWGILKHFAAKKQFGFTFQDVINEFPGRKPENLATILTKMVSQGMLLRLSKGIYSIIPLHESPETYDPKGLEIVKHLMGKREYCLAYASALKIHGIFPVLPENKLQEETWEFVVTTCQIKPAKKDFHGSRFQFICRKKSRYHGFMELWLNPYEKAISSDLERTIA